MIHNRRPAPPGGKDKEDKTSKRLKRKTSAYEDHSPLTPLEYFIYFATVLFMAVFGVMQLVFIYKLHVYETNLEETSVDHTKQELDARGALHKSATSSSSNNNNGALATTFQIAQSNRQRLQLLNITEHENNDNNMPEKWPPLEAIIDSTQNQIIGNPQFLLDFALLGFEKCGTQTLKFILSGHKQVDLRLDENVKLYMNKPADFVAYMYDHHPKKLNAIKRGYVNNADIFQPCSLKTLHTHFSDTKFVIALRHPIRMFESLYNARIQNLPDPNKQIDSPQERIGQCKPHHNGCCTDHAHYALWLYKLGKTLTLPTDDNQNMEIEEIIRNTHQFETEHETLPTKNKIFLVETSQLVDQDWFRKQQLLDDLQTFVGLDTEFRNGIPPNHPAPRSDTQSIRDKRKIDICQKQYNHLREELMQAARESSIWIRERFLQSPDVFVSSPDFFQQALLSWMEDPCDKSAATSSSNNKSSKSHEFDTKTIEGEIPFDATEQKPLPVKPGELKKFDIANEGWPDLNEVVDIENSQLIGDPQFLLDFAIIGIEKCGTSTLMKWLGAHPEVQCFQEEITDMFMNRPDRLARRLYKTYTGETFKRGYKNPIDLFQPCVLRNYQEIFPDTKLLITIRHPVRYFESLHNFRIQNLPDPNEEFTPVLERIGICNEHSQGLCTDHAHFALWMYRLGKTAEMKNTEVQKRIIDVHPWEAHHYLYPSNNKIFLTEMTQFQDKDPERSEALRRDLAEFLELKHPFDDNAPHAIPGKVWSAESQAIRDSRKIDICEPQYRPLREELMKGARETSLWIRSFFLASKDVYISSPDYFDQAMRAWMNDPCEDESQQDPRALSKWPRLSALVDDSDKIIGDVQFLLDFAIIGIEKCGTSTLMVWLGSHPEIQCHQEENYSMMNANPAQLVQDLYGMAPYEEYKRGYKNPMDVFYPRATFNYLDKYFPTTKLLITIRHPVRYFESLFNFRIQNHNEGNWKRSHIPTAFERIGPCLGAAGDGCTERAHFGLWLYRLGKTLGMPETETEKLLKVEKLDGRKIDKPKPLLNPVFLTEMTQFADKDLERQEKLKLDIKNFLGLKKDFEGAAPHFKPGKKWSKEIQAVRDSFKIDICEDQFQSLRDVLMKGARETSVWIRESFMKAPDVHISSPEFFEQAMLAWMDDPCDAVNGK